MTQPMTIRETTGDWDYRSLPPNIKIGADCWIEFKGSFDLFRSLRDPGVVLGARIRAFYWATFNVEPTGAVEVGDDSILVGPIFMCAERISIGKRVVISYNVTIADADFHPIDPEQRKLDAVANAPFGDRTKRPLYVSQPVVIEDDVWIGIGAIILKGVRIGKGARVGAGAVVTSDIPAGVEIVGNPARQIGEV